MPSGSVVDRGFNKLTRLNRIDPDQGLELRRAPEEYGYYLVDGVKQFYVSSKSRRSGNIGRGRLAQLCKYLKLKLNQNQFKDPCECRITGPQYHRMIRDRLGL